MYTLKKHNKCKATSGYVDKTQLKLKQNMVITLLHALDVFTGLILGLHPANERQHYFLTMSLTGWVQNLEPVLVQTT